jgi:leucyl-tRNA---protein transferase
VRRKSSLPCVVISADMHPCSYLPGQIACTPLRWPHTPPTPEQFDELLEEGDRRAGPVLYRTECPACHACEPLRIPVHRLEPTKSQRRVLRRNDDLRLEMRSPVASPDRVALYNRHRDERGLATTDCSIDEEDYRMQYVRSCVKTRG